MQISPMGIYAPTIERLRLYFRIATNTKEGYRFHFFIISLSMCKMIATTATSSSVRKIATDALAMYAIISNMPILLLY